MFVANPVRSAGMVSQLGILRERQSRNPATLAIKTAHTEIASVVNCPHTFPGQAVHPAPFAYAHATAGLMVFL